MIKIHAHFGRKVPGDKQYSSEQASASIDFEVADGDAGEIRQKLAGAWTMLRSAVDAELTQQTQHNQVPESNRIAQYSDFQNQSKVNGNGNGNYQNQPQNNDLQNPFGGGNGQRVQQANGVQQNSQVASTQRGAPNNGNGHQNPNGYQNNGSGAPSLNHQGNGQSAPHGLTSHNIGENATKKQIGYLFASARRTQNWNADQTKGWVAEQCGCDFNSITRQQASDLIETLIGKK